MGRIQTGVDKLVSLLHIKKKLTIEEAAKELGASKSIVQEWADFLQEEGLLDIKYSLSKTYLVERQLSKRDVEVKEKQFANQRETFIRKVDNSIAQIEHETASFEVFKKEFETLKKELGTNLEHMEQDFHQLKEYSDLRQQVNADLAKQHGAFAHKQNETETALKRQYAQYQEVLHAISQQEKKLSEHKAAVHELINSEESVGIKLSEYTKLLEKLKDRVDDETQQLGVDAQTLGRLRKEAQQFREKLAQIEHDDLKPLEEMREEAAAATKKIEERIIQKAALIDKTLADPAKSQEKTKQQIQTFLNKKTQIETLLHSIEQDKVSLLDELRELEQRAEAYSLGKTQVRLEELEGKLKTVEERKKGLAAHIGKFITLLRK